MPLVTRVRRDSSEPVRQQLLQCAICGLARASGRPVEPEPANPRSAPRSVGALAIQSDLIVEPGDSRLVPTCPMRVGPSLY